MNENIKWGAAAAAVVGLSIGGVLYFSQRESAAPPAEPVAVATPVPAAPAEPAIKHPVPASDSQDALPALDDSDIAAQMALADLIGNESVEQFVVTKDLVRHFVVTIDNLTEQKVAERIRAAKPVPGKFVVSGPEGEPVLDSANYERYKPAVQLIRSIDTPQLVATYTRYYPLFQDSYASLGHPPEYFNDRLVEVIDHLLATPDTGEPIALAQPGVLYEFADPKLESLSAGQKMLIRMGGENASTVKAKLRELRSALAARAPSKD